MDHEILKAIIRRKIKCSQTLWLIDTIIDNSNPQESVLEYFPGDDLFTPLDRRRGLPIGNLTSQFFANVYLNGFDHFVKETLNAKKYLRYVDDMALFSDDRAFLADAWVAISDYLEGLRLKLHPLKSHLFETHYGANFVGFRVLPYGAPFPKAVHIRVRNDNLRRSRHRLRRLQRDYSKGEVNLDDVKQRLQSWEAHLFHGNTCGLRRSVFDYWAFSREEGEDRIQESGEQVLSSEF